MPSELCCLIFMLDFWSFGQSQCRILARLQHQCQKVLLLCSERTCDTACLFDKLEVPTAGTKYRKLFGWSSGCMCYSMGCTIKPLAFCDNLLIPKRRVQWYNAWSRESTKCLELILTSSGATRWADDNFSEIRPATKTRPRVGLCESAWPCQQVNKFHCSSLQDPLSLKASPLFVEPLIFWEMACFEANLQYLRPGFACPRLRLPDGEQR